MFHREHIHQHIHRLYHLGYGFLFSRASLIKWSKHLHDNLTEFLHRCIFPILKCLAPAPNTLFPPRKNIVFQRFDFFLLQILHHSGFQERKHTVITEIFLYNSKSMCQCIYTRMIFHRHCHVDKIRNIIQRKYPLNKISRFFQISTHNCDIPVTVTLIHHKTTDLLCNPCYLLRRIIVTYYTDCLLIIGSCMIWITKQILFQMCKRMSFLPASAAIFSNKDRIRDYHMCFLRCEQQLINRLSGKCK